MLGSHGSNFMTHIQDMALVEGMVQAFAAVPYNAREFHAAMQQTPVNGDTLRAEQRWIDHAFWVARQFFTEQMFPDGAHLRLTQAFFIISLRLYLGKDGLSQRLIHTTATLIRDVNSGAFTLRTKPRPPSSKRALYHRNNYLPITLPADTELEVSALPVQWPASVRIDDLWEHDICAILALTPEFSAGLSVVRPNQPAIHAAQPYLRLLYTSTYWPAVVTSTNNDDLAGRQEPRVCVLVDECVRKMCTIRSMMYDTASYEIHYRTNAYWPSDEAEVEAAQPAVDAADPFGNYDDDDRDQRRPKPRARRAKRQDQGGLREDDEQPVRRRRIDVDSADEGAGAEAAAAAVPARRAANKSLVARRWAFNSCRRSDGRDFWLQPFAKFRDLSRNTNLPPRLAAELKAQTTEGYGQGVVPPRFDAASLASLYPELYMHAEDRLEIVRRASVPMRIDIIGEVLRLKTVHFEPMLASAME